MTICIRKLNRVEGVFIFFCVAFLFSLFSQPNLAYAHEMDGRTLAQKVFDRDDGKDAYAKVQMLLIDKRDNQRLRSMITANKEYGSLEKGYIRFTSPAAIEGTCFLYWENEDRDDDQFLYLPALRRVRRIAGTQKAKQFVNTDYTYEDMQKRKVDEDDHKVLRSEQLQAYDCWVLESVPKDPGNSQYGKRVSWIVKESFVPVKTEFFDKKDRLAKVFTAKSLSRIDGIWTVTLSEMHDLKREHKTLLKIDSMKYNSNIPDKVFTREYMKEGK